MKFFFIALPLLSSFSVTIWCVYTLSLAFQELNLALNVSLLTALALLCAGLAFDVLWNSVRLVEHGLSLPLDSWIAPIYSTQLYMHVGQHFFTGPFLNGTVFRPIIENMCGARISHPFRTILLGTVYDPQV